MPDIKLKGCPFCGSKGRYNKSLAYMWSAGCCLGHAVSPEFETKEEAANWWNRRHTDKKRITKMVASTGTCTSVPKRGNQ